MYYIDVLHAVVYAAWTQTDDEVAGEDAASDQDRREALEAKVNELELLSWTAGFDAAEIEFGETSDDEAMRHYWQAHPEEPEEKCGRAVEYRN